MSSVIKRQNMYNNRYGLKFPSLLFPITNIFKQERNYFARTRLTKQTVKLSYKQQRIENRKPTVTTVLFSVNHPSLWRSAVMTWPMTILSERSSDRDRWIWLVSFVLCGLPFRTHGLSSHTNGDWCIRNTQFVNLKRQLWYAHCRFSAPHGDTTCNWQVI